ncbi:hypothetical protein [Comamonas sp. JUb58]|uniref:hypothetical protein n=1 Tax=Comamonas sp. JUb58 TaxID=2485114 RepID=UPI00105D356B|nr:hypothetical protein [Comamonas sp. JUb58]TDS74378.1 hypothetical protein EDF71_11758 [Comamonas sp. JUb58]
MNNNVQGLRDILFDQLRNLVDPTKTVDLAQAGMVNETAQTIINSAKVEVEAAKVLKGALSIPFIESQEGCTERPYPEPKLTSAPSSPLPAPATAEDKEQAALSSGPGPNHPWRGLGARVHRLRG